MDAFPSQASCHAETQIAVGLGAMGRETRLMPVQTWPRVSQSVLGCGLLGFRFRFMHQIHEYPTWLVVTQAIRLRLLGSAGEQHLHSRRVCIVLSSRDERRRGPNRTPRRVSDHCWSSARRALPLGVRHRCCGSPLNEKPPLLGDNIGDMVPLCRLMPAASDTFDDVVLTSLVHLPPSYRPPC